MSVLVQASDLIIEYVTPRGRVRALDGADLTLTAGSSIGLVGESGSGKTTLGMAMGRLLPGNSVRLGGELRVDGQSIFDLDDSQLAQLRRTRLGFVFQNPMSALNPTSRIGIQVAHALGKKRPDDQVVELLRHVGLADEGRILKASLDASIRGQILDLLASLKDEIGMVLVLLSHELATVSRHCDMIGVMYGGRVVEYGTSREIFGNPTHPYTSALLRAAPGRERPGERLSPIPGSPPVLAAASEGCSFAPRCPMVIDTCRRVRPNPRSVAGRLTLCHRAEEIVARPSDHEAVYG